VDVAQIVGGLALHLPAARYLDSVALLEAADEVRQRAAAVRRDDPEVRILVEESVEDHSRHRERRVEHEADRPAEVVLPHVHHLAEAVTALVDMLIANAPGVGVLVTSQETLRASDEHVYRLGGPVTPDTAACGSCAASG